MSNTALTKNDEDNSKISVKNMRTGYMRMIGLDICDIATIESITPASVYDRLRAVPDSLLEIPLSLLAGGAKVMNAVNEAADMMIESMRDEALPKQFRYTVARDIYDRSVAVIQRNQLDQGKLKAKDSSDSEDDIPQSEINRLCIASATHILEAKAERKRKEQANKVDAEAEVVQCTIEEDDKNEPGDTGDGGHPHP